MKERMSTGEKFRLDDGKTYQALLYAKSVPAGKRMLVFQELSGEFEILTEDEEKVLCRKVDDFRNEKEGSTEETVKKAKENVNVTGKTAEEIPNQSEEEKEMEEEKETEEEKINPLLMKFLDADSIEEKYDLLMKEKNKIDVNFLSSAAFSIDCTLPEGDIEEQFQALKYSLLTKRKYESSRLH